MEAQALHGRQRLGGGLDGPSDASLRIGCAGTAVAGHGPCHSFARLACRVFPGAAFPDGHIQDSSGSARLRLTSHYHARPRRRSERSTLARFVRPGVHRGSDEKVPCATVDAMAALIGVSTSITIGKHPERAYLNSAYIAAVQQA